jgi:hypothetical protein
MVVKTSTAIMAATTAAAILLFEILPFSSCQATMMIMTLYMPYSNNNNYSLHQQSFEGDRKHNIAVVTSRWNGGGASTSGIGNMGTESSIIIMMMDSRLPSSSSSSASSSSATNPTTKNKLVHSSFRIEEDVIKSLEIAAEKRGISLSSLVNKILKNYTTSEMYFEELGFILVSKNFLRKTFDELGAKQIQQLGKEYGTTIAREYISYFYPQVNSNTLVQFLDIWFKRFSSYQHRVDYENNKCHYYTVNHDINMNFSMALQSILEGLIEPIIKSTVEFTNITNTSITFSFEVQL